jgi:CRISPR-associated endonuclease Csn1
MDTPWYVLGLDLGSASLGWALVELNGQREPVGLMRAGVRIFQPGVEGSFIEIEQGKDRSRAASRREARLHRRQLRRRTARQRDLFRLLQQQGLLPPTLDNSSHAEQRHEILNELDRTLLQRVRANSDFTIATDQLLPYVLRKTALDHKLEPFELGRVFYHLIQCRGFKSNRREGRKQKDKAEELGKVKSEISELESEMRAANARTLGEYIAGLNPHVQKVRRRWTARWMFEREFELIWSFQQQFHSSILTPELKTEIQKLLFFQRPIARQSHLIGRCELEPGEARAPWGSIEAQSFRVLQKVNDLEIIPPGSFESRELATEERDLVLRALQTADEQTFADLRKLLKLPRGSQFNLERGEEKRLRGNRTLKLFRTVFGPRWELLAAEQQRTAVADWMDTESPEELFAIGTQKWQLDADRSREWADSDPEDGYCSLSLKALRRLLPMMEEGIPFKTAERAVYGERFSGQEPHELLPILRETVPELRNPAVERALTEMRKVVNSIVRECGKPYEIRIEMARELRKPRKEREAATRLSRSQQRMREKAKARILSECAGFQNPSRADIEKALLFEECSGICPYTGKSIEFSSLFTDSQFDVEHIIPISRYPDDSFLNKTLCYHEENRSVKRGHTPWEAYGSDEAKFTEILTRVQKFGNPAKLFRFRIRSAEDLAEFTNRQLNDTRYTTRLASKLLEELYGGRDVTQANGTTRRAIFASTGQITATLRRAWKLESILREPSSAATQAFGKPRTDHRHHAIDAIVVALTNERTVRALSTAAAAANSWEVDARAFRRIESPWPNFVDSIRPHIEQMTVSHRPEHKMTGALHKETIFGQPRSFNGKSVVHIRRPLPGIPAGQVEKIVDPAVRDAVRRKLDELGGDTKRFNDSDQTTLPHLPSRNGKRIPIKRVRVREAKTPESLIELPGHRFAESDSIHHFEIFVCREGSKEVWRHESVSLFEANQRKRRGESVVRKSLPDDPDVAFLFSLMKGDTIEIDRNGKREICRVKKFYASGQIWLAHCNNAQSDEDQQRDKTRWSKRANALKELHPRKVVVDLLGRIHSAND